MNKYRVLIVDQSDKTSSVHYVTAKHSRLALEDAMREIGFAPWKFNTTMLLDRSTTSKSLFQSKGLGETLLESFVYLEKSAS